MYCQYVTQLADYYIGSTFSIWQVEIVCNRNGRMLVCTVNMRRIWLTIILVLHSVSGKLKSPAIQMVGFLYVLSICDTIG